MEYCVNVRRILREDTNVYVEANSPEEAAEKAKLRGSACEDGQEWDCYDAEYSADIEDVEEME